MIYASNYIFGLPNYKRGILTQLYVNNQNIIMPWGVEFADSSSFYSLEDGYGYRYETLNQTEFTNNFQHKVTQIIKMREGLVRLELNEWLESPTNFRRICKLTCIEDTILMDFVLRFRFTPYFQEGYIAEKVYIYEGTNVYHQYPVETAGVGNSQYSIWVSVVKKIVPPSMEGYMYLRDTSDHWVLHVRMLPVKWDKEVIKLCSKWFKTKPLPQCISFPLLKIPSLKKSIWYRGERKPYTNRAIRIFSPNAYPMVELEKGQVLLWDVSCTIEAPFSTEHL